MLPIFTKFLDSNDKQVKRLTKILDQINDIKGSDYKDLISSTEDLRSKVRKSLKDIIAKDYFDEADVKKIKAELLKIIPIAYHLVRRAGAQELKHKHYDVQLLAGIALFEGKLIELGTGEGKTLVATLPLYLYSLLGLGNHIVTVNDYLARRDGEWCGHIYNALGLTTGIINSDKSYKFVKDVSQIKTPEEIAAAEGMQLKLNQMHGFNLVECSKKEAYQCDIVYCTNNELGFDYLRDNMAINLSDMVLRKFLYCIVDEADSILIDESRTPLIVSAPSEQSNDLYVKFADVVKRLKKDEDYSVDEKQKKVIINDSGIDKVEKLLNIKNIWEDFLLAHHLENALSAKEIFKNGDEYIVKSGEVLIVDEFTGRLMPGRRFSEGIHQAIEAKERVSIKEESRTMAQITFQNLFRLYPVLSGMTGTALTEAEEFSKIYNLEVVVIPPNKTLIRKDLNDIIFKSEKAKVNAVVNDIKERHEKGQPVLVGTVSVEKSEELSMMLKKKGLVHEVLNAKYHEKEAEIIAHAGEKGQITISTNMAGRGTDIVLTDDVRELGGLAVIGTERHEARRIDNQLRGRAGRQGDPGETRFYVSLDDSLMRIFGGSRVSSLMTTLKFDENLPLEFGIFSRQIESAQKKVEHMNFDYRKHLVEYDDVLNIQREIIYKRRRYIISLFSDSEDSTKDLERREYIIQKIKNEINLIIDSHSDYAELDEFALDKVFNEANEIIPNDLANKTLEKNGSSRNEWIELIKLGKKKVLAEKLKEQYEFLIEEVYDYQVEVLTPSVFNEKNKRDMIRVIDILWVDHLDAIESLKEAISLSHLSQRDPLVEYKNDAYLLFEDLVSAIESQTAKSIFKYAQLAEKQIFEGVKLVTNSADIESELTEKQFVKPVNKPIVVTNKQPILSKMESKIGRNDLCYCGSGKKYKKCHGK